MDLSGLSDADLKAIAAGDMKSVSDDGLRQIAGVQAPPNPAHQLGQALYDAIHHAVRAASPFDNGPVTDAATELGQSGAPGVAAAMTGQTLPPDASIPSRVMRTAADPAVLGNLAAMAATGGASIPVQAGMAALGAGSGRALQEGIRQASTGEDSTTDVVGEGAKAAAIAGGAQAIVGAAGQKIIESLPAIKKIGAQVLRVLGGTPEKYGQAVLNDPSILTRAESRVAASQTYKQAVGDLGGMTDFLQNKTGKILPSQASIEDLVNEASSKLNEYQMYGKPALPLDEALASRQAAENILQMAKFGDPRARAVKAAVVEFKNGVDDYLEAGLPGFKDASRKYFEANAKEAFQSLFPLNKNMSPNALRGLGMLSEIAGSALLNSPKLLVTAGMSSPAMQGLAIRGIAAMAEPTALAAQFASRVAAARASEGNGQ